MQGGPVVTDHASGVSGLWPIEAVTVAMVAWGLATVVAVGVLPGSIAGLLAIVHLGLFCGLPAAVATGRRGGELPIVAGLLSLAITGLCAQPLVWLHVWSAWALVLVATVVGAVVASIGIVARRYDR